MLCTFNNAGAFFEVEHSEANETEELSEVRDGNERCIALLYGEGRVQENLEGRNNASISGVNDREDTKRRAERQVYVKKLSAR